MLTRNKKLKDYGIPAEDIEKLNTMLKDFPTEYGYLLTSAALSACPKNTVIADMVVENILHRKSYRKISRERYIPMNPKDFYGYRRKTVAVLYERMRLLGVWEDEQMSRLIDADDLIEYIKIWEIGNSISSDQKEFIDCINRQPTVFDVDEVVRQLETLIEDKVSESGDDWYTAQCLNEAVDIVRGGGVE